MPHEHPHGCVSSEDRPSGQQEVRKTTQRVHIHSPVHGLTEDRFRGSRFKTYAWVRGTDLNDELNHKRVVRAIDVQLVSKGLTRVDSGAKPDVLVAYHASFNQNLQITGFSSGWAGYRFGGTGSATTQKIVTGTLVVDVIDARTGTIVWRGIASRDVDAGAKPEKREKNINTAAEKVFKNYPPKA